MTRILLRKHFNALRPVDQQAEEVLAKIKQGEQVRAEVKRVRNAAQLRLWWALVTLIYEHQSRYPTKEMVHEALKCWLGYCEEITLRDGRVAVKAKSVAFGNLSQSAWEELFEAAIRFVCTEIIPSTSNEDLRAELSAMVGIEGDAA